jgi:peptide/nickel transport system permease protein
MGLSFVAVLTFVSMLAPLLAPNDPVEQDLKNRLQVFSWKYPLGTDEMGRCVLSRLIYGARVSLLIAVAVVAITGTLGTSLGLLSGYFGKAIDEILMRLVDMLTAFPGLVLALVMAGILGPGILNVIFSLCIVGWTRYARLVRGCVLSAKKRTFVEATRALGTSDTYILFRHILPEILSPVIVMATLGMGWAILAAAAMNFLGFGVQPPTPEWGSMINSGRSFLRVAHHLVTYPGLAIMLTVLAFNFLGDGLRDALAPKRREDFR